MSVVAVQSHERFESDDGAWRRAAIASADGAVLVHVSDAAEHAPRVAPVVQALESTGIFNQVVLDLASEPGTARILSELSATAAVVRVPVALDAIRAELACTRSIAVVLHGSGHAALIAALAAVRERLSVVRVGGGEPLSGIERAISRLADLHLASGHDEARALRARVAPERVHVVGNPLIDAVRVHARAAAARAEWRRHGVVPRSFVLAVLPQPPAGELRAALAALAARVPVVLETGVGAADLGSPGAVAVRTPGFVEHLSLLRGAGAVVTDSPRVQEEAAVLGVRCYALGEPGSRVRAEVGGTTVALAAAAEVAAVRPDPGADTPCVIPLWDGRAGARIASVLVANFARLRLA
jgi:UDP-N-acetylglucosamine 2-epimerase (non-hydrolysing)